MNYISLKEIDREKFAYEIKKIKLEEELYFNMTDSLLKNIEIFIYYLKLKKVKKIHLRKNKNVDPICHKKFMSYFLQNYLIIIKDIVIKLEDYPEAELQILLGERLYLNYCESNNLAPLWHENLLKKEIKKNEKHKHLLKYDTYKILLETQKELPFSYFNYPQEKDAGRFVFYFHMYSQNQKENILKLIKQLNIENSQKIRELIQTNKINEEIYYYALGFLYKDNKLQRLTLYTKFDPLLVYSNKISDFLKNKHELTNIPKHKNMWYYAYDIYMHGYEELKLYDEPYQFREELNDKSMEKILNNKRCVRVLKYRDNKNSATKFEFETQIFKDEEKNLLIKKEIIDKNSNIFAIYIKEHEIVKTVKYEL